MHLLWTNRASQRNSVSKPTIHSASRTMDSIQEAETNTTPLSPSGEIIPTDPKIAASMHPDTWTTVGGMQYGDRLHEGKNGSVFHGFINGNECVVKAYKDEKLFFRELETYERLKSVEELTNRIPGFMGSLKGARQTLAYCGYNEDVSDNALVIECVRGIMFEQIHYTFSEEKLAEMHETCKRTIVILHQHGVAHGDPSGNHIQVSPDGKVDGCRLFDFSHAKWKEEMGEMQWMAAMHWDLKILKEVFGRGKLYRPDPLTASSSSTKIGPIIEEESGEETEVETPKAGPSSSPKAGRTKR